MYDLLLLYSGGLESRYLLHVALGLEHKPLCVLVNYGQKHVAELKKAESVCNKLGVDFETVSIHIPTKSKLTGNSQTTYDGVSEWYVPARNLMLISIAASIAESNGMNPINIWYGASYTDRVNQFPDCTQEWVVAVNNLLSISFSRPAQLIAPLLGVPKPLVIELAKRVGITNEEVYSGYGEQ